MDIRADGQAGETNMKIIRWWFKKRISLITLAEDTQPIISFSLHDIRISLKQDDYTNLWLVINTHEMDKLIRQWRRFRGYNDDISS